MSTVAESVRRFLPNALANRGDRTAGKSFCRFCQSAGSIILNRAALVEQIQQARETLEKL